MSYLVIQAVWVGLVFLTPIAASLHPSKLWALPFSGVTAAGGLHLTYYRREYNALMGKLAAGLPFARRLGPTRYKAGYYLPLGIGYTLLGAGSAALVIFS